MKPSARGRRLEAPHRRREPRNRPLRHGTRIVERAIVPGYRAVSWVLSRLPLRVGSGIVGRGAQLSYLLWPSKRRTSNLNFAHVLGLPPDDPRVRALALQAYRAFGRYLVEVMRLPEVPPDDTRSLLPEADVEGFEELRRASDRGLIIVAAHIGNNEAVAAALATRGWPVSVLADDSTFPELFEHFRRMRQRWNVRIVPWRNIREIYGVLRRGEMLALLVDWGYRPDGIPVRLFGAWTTLPAGPATLAAKSGARILPIAVRRRPDGRFHAEYGVPIEVASSEPAELHRATQALADALEATIAAAPEQWYSFKPLWPDSPAEAAELERRAMAELEAGPA